MPMTTRGRGQGRPTMTKASPLVALVRKKKTSKKVNVKPTKALTQVVNKIIRGKEETKFAIDYPFNTGTATNLQLAIPFTSAITSTSELYNLLPRIIQGVDDNQRIGNIIMPSSLSVWTNVFIPVVGSNTSQNVVVDLYYLTCKSIKDNSYSGNVPTGTMLNQGNGTNVNYDGTMQRAYFPVNTSDFTVLKHKRLKLQKGGGDPNSAISSTGLPPTDAMQYYYATYKTKIPVPKKLSYETSTTLTPTNYYPFLCLGFHSEDGNGDTASINGRVFVRAQSQLYYKDA